MRTLATAVLPLLLLAGTGLAATRAGTDRDAGVRFRLDADLLTVRLVPQQDREPADARRELWGARIRAVCATTFDTRKARHHSVTRTRRWRSGRIKLSFRFGRDISRRAKWCLLERTDGGDVAAVQFKHLIRVIGTSGDDRRTGRELRRYLRRAARHTRWYRRVKVISVDRQVIAVITSLRQNAAGRRVAARLCNLIQGADVADFTPGHTIFGREEVRLKVCPARQE